MTMYFINKHDLNKFEWINKYNQSALSLKKLDAKEILKRTIYLDVDKIDNLINEIEKTRFKYLVGKNFFQYLLSYFKKTNILKNKGKFINYLKKINFINQ